MDTVDTIRGPLHAATYVASVTDKLAIDLDAVDQQRDILYSPVRFNLIAGGERGAKSFTSAVYLTTRVPLGQLYWVVGPTYELARPEFEYTLEFLNKLGAIASKNDVSLPKTGKAEMRLKTGQLIETKSSDDVKKIAARPPDGVLMTEAAQQDVEAYYKCVGRVAQKRGWLLLSGTFEGSLGWYPDLFNEWASPDNGVGRSWSLPSWGNRAVYPGGREDPEIKRLEQIYSRVPGLFEERCGAIPVPPAGLVFREFSRVVHVAETEFDPNLPVYLAVDPSAGSAPYAVLACQFKKPRWEHRHDRIDVCHIIDEIYHEGGTGDDVRKIVSKRRWSSAIKGGAIDVEAPDEKRRWALYNGVVLRADKIPQIHGIRRLKSFLFRDADYGPHLVVSPKCAGIINEFGKYKRKDPADEDLYPAEAPPGNQPNHSIKALWYLLVARYGFVKGSQLPGIVRHWKNRLLTPRGHDAKRPAGNS